MLHHLFIGLLLGWGAAIPIGPMNLEIIRRNLRFGTRFGVSFGCGAVSADLTYLIFLTFGAILVLTHPTVLSIVGVLGSLVLAWFGYKAITMPPPSKKTDEDLKNTPLYRHYLAGLFLTLLNPMTILFWSSVSSQIANLARDANDSLLGTGIGVLFGALSWSLGLNLVLHITRHRLSEKTMHRFNIVGGIILVGFAAYGLYHAFF